MSVPIITSITRATGWITTEESQTYEEILADFSDGDGSLVNALVRRCQALEAELAVYKEYFESVQGLSKMSWDAQQLANKASKAVYDMRGERQP